VAWLRQVRDVCVSVTLLAYCLFAFERGQTSPGHSVGSLPWFQLSILPVTLGLLGCCSSAAKAAPRKTSSCTIAPCWRPVPSGWRYSVWAWPASEPYPRRGRSRRRPTTASRLILRRAAGPNGSPTA
jgi:hypothetical protein